MAFPFSDGGGEGTVFSQLCDEHFPKIYTAIWLSTLLSQTRFAHLRTFRCAPISNTRSTASEVATFHTSAQYFFHCTCLSKRLLSPGRLEFLASVAHLQWLSQELQCLPFPSNQFPTLLLAGTFPSDASWLWHQLQSTRSVFLSDFRVWSLHTVALIRSDPTNLRCNRVAGGTSFLLFRSNKINRVGWRLAVVEDPILHPLTGAGSLYPRNHE